MKTASAAATVIGAASKASNFASQTVETARTEVLKEPLGFIKLLEFVIAIITFAVACNGGEKIAFQVTCPGATNVLTTASASYSYPYNLQSASWSISSPVPLKTPNSLCNSHNETTTTITNSSTASVMASAGFFVFTGVMSFLYTLAFIIIYVFFRHKYEHNPFFPLVDFAFTVIITIFWFAGSIAFSKMTNDIQHYTNPQTYLSIFNVCNAANVTPAPCSSTSPSPTYATLIVACIFGFANFLMWSGNCWFVLKETGWYKNKYQVNQRQHPQMSSSGSSNKI